MILKYFYESMDAESNSVYCDCCDVNFSDMVDGKKDMIVIAKALKEIPCTGETEGG